LTPPVRANAGTAASAEAEQEWIKQITVVAKTLYHKANHWYPGTHIHKTQRPRIPCGTRIKSASPLEQGISI